MEAKLVSLQLGGFKSIGGMQLDFRDINLMIGANGAGKSCLVAFFEMLNHLLSPPSGALQLYVGKAGGANDLLHDGARCSEGMAATLTLQTGQELNEYAFRLVYAAGDRFVFEEERCRFSSPLAAGEPRWITMGSGHREAEIIGLAGDEARQTTATMLTLLRKLVVYQFNDTSRTARIRTRWDQQDNLSLKHDGANLGPFLLRLATDQPRYFRRIVENIRMVAPFFRDFVLEPDAGRVFLQWREQESDMLFGAHQASDGFLRSVALISLLLQPVENMPALLILDEPELGLHPAAITLVGNLLRAASQHCQVLVATQSPLLLDQFEAEDVIVVERTGRSSHYRRLDEAALIEWLDTYSLSELWHKNVLGGRPRWLGGRHENH